MSNILDGIFIEIVIKVQITFFIFQFWNLDRIRIKERTDTDRNQDGKYKSEDWHLIDLIFEAFGPLPVVSNFSQLT